MTPTRRFCTFSLDGLLFGIEVRHLQEVLRFQALTRVPLAPAAVRGLINLRGEILTALDLRRRLQLAERPPDQLPMNVVVRTSAGAVALLVDEIHDVLDVAEGDFERPPETLRGLARELIQGAYKLAERPLLVLDLEKTVDLAGVPNR